ncbi:pyruvate/2-oxoglutarate dehydrogenase complex dihydrolipoamide dehydrogenase (E3) component [Micromonospora sp. Llam0]|uniref:dihydrolipoyl dehydrogenase family protein n=1 Tax=Micromonospora sp. Llam0 TaxID=2485143 RepID=UPI000F466326|nr:FAD-dependent oxidoreductase [Micromonospora sp. Llam0]ROO51984.1 pyruvate/2-oxoglutarate dehydrogenase complex dihydrolipoamide dehydrogenase (E3) component [Micromonospora sp. Llam0]
MDEWDLAIIGGGTAGIVAAKTAGRFGARVLLVESARTGGDCLWTGCVPSKSLIAAAHAAHTVRTAARFGVHAGPPKVDDAAVLAYVRAAIARIEPVDSPAAISADGAQVVTGRAEFTGPGSLRVTGAVGERAVRFRWAVLATGAAPAVPDLPGLAEADPLTTETLWDLDALPERVAVLGGGPVGCELGQALARLGVRVTIVQRADRLLTKEEPEVGALIAERLRAEGVAVLSGADVERVDGGTVQLTGADPVVVDRILVATGRRPRTGGLGLAAAGVRCDERGHVVVDGLLRTSNRRIFAAGDVTGVLPFTHVAGVQGGYAATNALLGLRRRVDYAAIPWVTFTDPEVAHVGATLAQARRRHGDRVHYRRLTHEHVDRAITDGRPDGFTLLVIGPADRLLGATVVSPRAGESIAELAAAIRRGAKVRDVAGTVHAYPTYADGPWNASLAQVRADLAGPLLSRAIGGLRGLRRALHPVRGDRR